MYEDRSILKDINENNVNEKVSEKILEIGNKKNEKNLKGEKFLT